MTTAATAAATALRVEIHDGVAVVTFDLPGEPVNKFSMAVAQEFRETFDRLERDPSVTAAVLISGKSDVFIAGADIEEFLTIRDAADAARRSADGHQMLAQLERGKPVVAAIHGACMGGGLECALACAYRIATDHPKTVLALPEVQLGIIPGLGGTQRLPRAVGLATALDMILTGRNVRAKKAWQTGLVDELVHPSILRDIAVRRARELGAGTLKRSTGNRKTDAKSLVLEKTPMGRNLVFRKAREGVLEKSHGHYPAPLAAIDVVRIGIEKGMEAGLREESRVFGEMAATDVSKQLIFLFFATTALKKDPGVDEPAPTPAEIRKVGLLGAGFMGAGIASVVAPQGVLLRMKDADSGRVAKGLASVREVLSERVKKKQMTRLQFEDTMVLVGGTTDYSGFANVDLVIEAVFEDLGVKHQVLKETEAVTGERAIFASNTSTIPIARIAQASKRPDHVLGMHFFSPVHKMPLLEVIVTPRTARAVTATVVAFGKKIGKTVIVVNDGPGFYANRILSPYINEAGRLLDAGASIDAIDQAMVQFGFPVGPITLLDEVGLDVAGKVGAIIAEAFGERLSPSQSLQRVVEAGRLGRKGKLGFYSYGPDGKKGGVDETVYSLLPTGAQRSEISAAEIQQRCVLGMVNEAARCLEENIVRSPRDGDVGAVFGIGFPPFRGGPFRYMDSVGVDEIVRRLEELNGRFPPRFAPCDLLVDMARRKARFYPEKGHPLG